MKKSAVTVLASVLICAFVFVAAHSQEDMEFVDNSVFLNPQRTAAVFQHDVHNEQAEIEECYECHHLYEDGQLVEEESSEDQSCSECHALESSGDQPALMEAFHRNCKGCHVKKQKGPIMCGECHVK